MGKNFNDCKEIMKSVFEDDTENLGNEVVLDVEEILNMLEIGLLTTHPINPDMQYGIQFKIETKRPFPFLKRVHSISAIVQWDF